MCVSILVYVGNTHFTILTLRVGHLCFGRLYLFIRDTFCCSAYIRVKRTHFANPMKSSWLVFMYASSQSISKTSWSLHFCSRERTCDIIIRSVSSRRRGYRDIYQYTKINMIFFNVEIRQTSCSTEGDDSRL